MCQHQFSKKKNEFSNVSALGQLLYKALERVLLRIIFFVLESVLAHLSSSQTSVPYYISHITELERMLLRNVCRLFISQMYQGRDV